MTDEKKEKGLQEKSNRKFYDRFYLFLKKLIDN